MIADVARLTAWEWSKIRRRWMPWILLAVAVLIMQLGLWFAYSAYHNETLQGFASGGTNSFGTAFEEEGKTVSVEVSCVDLANEDTPPELEMLSQENRQIFLEDMERFREESCGDTTAREELREAFVLPSAITGSVTEAVGIAPILIMILAGSAMGAEYGWGTLRTTLTRGTGRWQLLTSKLALLVLATAGALVIVAAASVVATVVAALIPPSEEGGFADAGKWSDVGIAFLRALYALAPYIALGTFLAVLTQSSAMSIALSLGYYVVELIVMPLLGLNETLAKATGYILGGSVGEWMESAFITITVEASSGEASGEAPAVDQPDALQAFLVILAYTLVLGVAAYWIFQRRDITGAKGG
jgi:ABC-type transport system involved in multi-copper enzyme maturation permease subunit